MRDGRGARSTATRRGDSGQSCFLDLVVRGAKGEHASEIPSGAVDDVGGKWRRTRGGGGGSGREVAGEVEISEHYVAGGTEEDVLWLEVAVGNADGVEVAEGDDDLGEVEADRRRGERLFVGRRKGTSESVEVAA